MRLKDRFVHHYRDSDIGDPDKPVGHHFAQSNHNGYKNMSITVLEYIKMPPRCPQAAAKRLEIECNWTHLLRTLAPKGLNQENPKQYMSHKT